MPSRLVESMLAFGSVVRPYMQAEIHAVLAAADLDERDLMILQCVASEKSVPFSELASKLRAGNRKGLSKARLSTAASKLYKEEYLDKRPSPENQRQLELTFRPKGRQLLTKIDRIRAATYEKVEAAMGLEPALMERLATAFKDGTTRFAELVAKK